MPNWKLVEWFVLYYSSGQGIAFRNPPRKGIIVILSGPGELDLTINPCLTLYIEASSKLAKPPSPINIVPSSPPDLHGIFYGIQSWNTPSLFLDPDEKK
jgi:hypothetical protein